MPLLAGLKEIVVELGAVDCSSFSGFVRGRGFAGESFDSIALEAEAAWVEVALPLSDADVPERLLFGLGVLRGTDCPPTLE